MLDACHLWCRLQRAFNGLRPAVGATWLWFVGRLWWWRGLACGRRWVCGAHRGLVEVTALAWGCAPVVWVAGCVGWEPWWMPAARGVGPSRFSFAAPRWETNCSAMFFCLDESQRLSVSSRRGHQRGAHDVHSVPEFRCHSVHGRRRSRRETHRQAPRVTHRLRPAAGDTAPSSRHRRRNPPARGEAPEKHHRPAQRRTEEQVAQPPENTTRNADEPRRGRRTGNGPPQATPTVNKEPRKNPPARGEAPDHHDDDHDDETRTAKPGKAQPPRSGDTTDKAAQRPGKR
jgi:hypothetical protein